ncbi:MAG TPA: glycosyltransferase family 87 protein [Acidimicrobiales bacterium]|nr:glycosyltransferase family 87 protein [Acidimicrobiales bacterium]
MGSAAAHRRALRRRRLALLAVVGVLLCGQMYVLAYKGVNYGLDLGPVWVSAENFLRHRPIYAGQVETITFSFLPPSGALLTSPLGLMSFAVAARAFLGLQILLLAVSTGFFVRRFSGRRWLPALVGGAVGLALSQPFIFTLRFGSVNGLLVAAMLMFFVGVADGRRWTGLLLGVSLALKPVLWPLAALLLVRRQYRQVAAAIAVLTGLLLVATALARDGTNYLTKVLPYLARGEPGLERFNVSILGLTQQAGWPGAWAVLGRVAVAGGAVALCLRLWRREPNDFDLVEAGTALVLAGVVVSSWATFYYAAFAFPALLLFPDRRAAASSLVLWPFVLAVGVPITFGSDLVTNTRTLVGMLGILFVVAMRVGRGDPLEDGSSPVSGGQLRPVVVHSI